MQPTPLRPASPLLVGAAVGLVVCALLVSTVHALRAVLLLPEVAQAVSAQTQAMGSMGHADHKTPTHPQHDHCPLCTLQFTDPGPGNERTVGWGSPQHQPRLRFSPPQPQRIHYLPTASRAPPIPGLGFSCRLATPPRFAAKEASRFTRRKYATPRSARRKYAST